MNHELIQEVMKRLDTIGGAVANGGRYAFDHMVRLERINSIVNLVTFSIIGVMAVVVFLLAARYNHRKSTINSMQEQNAFVRQYSEWQARDARNWCFVGCAVGVFVVLMAICDNIPGIFAPEAVVIRELIERVTK